MRRRRSHVRMTESGQIEFRDNSLHAAGLAQGGMEVLSALDERYLHHTATMLCSLLEHNTVSRIHLFYSSVDNQELAKLESFVAEIWLHNRTLRDGPRQLSRFPG